MIVVSYYYLSEILKILKQLKKSFLRLVCGSSRRLGTSLTNTS